MTGFKLRGEITEVELIAAGRKIRDLATLRKLYGSGRWRKPNGKALVELPDGTVAEAELHWVRGSRGWPGGHESQAAAGITMPRRQGRFVLCVRNGSYKASLEPRKVYRVVQDPEAEAISLLRVIDESGEDYLFPAYLFAPIEVPATARPAFTRGASGSEASRPARTSSRPTMR